MLSMMSSRAWGSVSPRRRESLKKLFAEEGSQTRSTKSQAFYRPSQALSFTHLSLSRGIPPPRAIREGAWDTRQQKIRRLRTVHSRTVRLPSVLRGSPLRPY